MTESSLRSKSRGASRGRVKRTSDAVDRKSKRRTKRSTKELIDNTKNEEELETDSLCTEKWDKHDAVQDKAHHEPHVDKLEKKKSKSRRKKRSSLKPIDGDQILNGARKLEESEQESKKAVEEEKTVSVANIEEVVADVKAVTEVEIKSDAPGQESQERADTEISNNSKEPDQIDTEAETVPSAEKKSSSDESEPVQEKEEVEKIFEEIVETVEEGATVTEVILEEKQQAEKISDKVAELSESAPDGQKERPKSKSKKSKSRKSKSRSKRKSTRRKKKQDDSVDKEDVKPLEIEAEPAQGTSQPTEEVPSAEEIKAPENLTENHITEPIKEIIVEKKDESKNKIKRKKSVKKPKRNNSQEEPVAGGKVREIIKTLSKQRKSKQRPEARERSKQLENVRRSKRGTVQGLRSQFEQPRLDI